MASETRSAAIQLAARAVCVGIGSVVAGPLGGLTGAFVGGALQDILGEPLAKLAETGVGKFIEKVSDILFDKGADSLADGLKAKRPTLEAVYRQAFRRSLNHIASKADPAYADWFFHWDEALKGDVRLVLEEIQPARIVPEQFDSLFRNAMERLDLQGINLERKGRGVGFESRRAEEPLLKLLKERLPGEFEVEFRSLIIQPEQAAAWNEAQLAFQKSLSATVDETNAIVKAIADQTKPIPQIVDRLEKTVTKEDFAEFANRFAPLLEAFEQNKRAAEESGQIPRQSESEKDAELARLRQVVGEMEAKAKAESPESVAARVFNLIQEGKIEEARDLNSRQIDSLKPSVGKLAAAYYQAGQIAEIASDWLGALANYRQAWELSKDAVYGFRYARFAQKLNRHSEAIRAYEAVLGLYTDPADRAKTLNNLGLLYSATQRLAEAEGAYGESLGIYRKLAEGNAAAYLPYVAGTLNNLGLLYSDTQRLAEAEGAYGEALGIYRKLAEVNAAAYLPYVAMTLNNLGLLYRATQRLGAAEGAYVESLGIRRKLAEGNAAAYLPDVAASLNNLGNLYSVTQRLAEAEGAYGEALGIYRKLAEGNAAAYLPDVAATLFNLALFCLSSGRMGEAEGHAAEAEGILEPLWRANPAAHGNQMAKTLWTRALLREAAGDAGGACGLARRALEAAYDPGVKEGVLAVMGRVCGAAGQRVSELAS